MIEKVNPSHPDKLVLLIENLVLIWLTLLRVEDFTVKTYQNAGEYQGQNVYEIYKVCPACGNDEIHYYDDWEI